ncbi:MAG: 4-hydroxythreonine-4-phosphate dehydrogenase PdxA [Candidatus Omnitrophota bacterium]
MIKVGITMGDPSGIGPAITAAAINKLKRHRADFLVIGDEWVFNKASNPKLHPQNYKFIDLHNVCRDNFSFGKVRAEYGRASIEYLDKALELLKDNSIDCLVTCPISKEAIKKAGFTYGGHTEYLSERTGAKDPVMMLLNKELRFALVSRHIPLKNVSSAISREALRKTISLARESLKKLFLIKEPRIVVCGLNPHASDNGSIGLEENKVIRPLLNKLKIKMKYLSGPISADVAIAKANRKEYDCVIAMYHDQALIPLKLCPGNKGVNITLGLPFIRTSPLHGTAFDIAANRISANPDSLMEAILLAVKCAPNLKKD